MATSSAWAGGATNVSVTFRADVISTGLPYTAGAYNTATISAHYQRTGAAAVSITLVTQTAAGVWTSGGFVHLGKGKYRMDVPNAAFVAGVDQVNLAIDGIADVAWSDWTIDLTGSNPRAAVSADVNVISISGDTTAADNLEAAFDGTGGVTFSAALTSTERTAIGTATWAIGTRVLTAGTNIVLTKGVGVTGFNDLAAADVRAALGVATPNLDSQLDLIGTNVTGIFTDTQTIRNLTDFLTQTGGNLNVNVEAINAAAIYGNGTSGNLFRATP